MTNNEMLKIASEAISKIENNEFNIYFFVLDTKGNPSSQVEYFYRTALALKNMGYNVAMLHNEENFVGVSDWLGKDYDNIKHYNIEKENVPIKSSDFLFIPEILANVMMQTIKLPCKRVVVVQNYNHLTEFMPVSQNMETLAIRDAIITTEAQAEKIERYFPGLRTHIVHPAISDKFEKSNKPQQMIVNIISKNQSFVHQIVKPFYWMYDLYKWVSFRDLRGVTQDLFSESLKESAITIWIDDDTNFGCTLLDALKSGTIVLAKIPDHPSEWMLDENGDLTDSIIWFDDFDNVPHMLASLVRSWTNDSIPNEIYDKQEKFNEMFTEKQQIKEIKQVYVDEIINKRLEEFKEVKKDIENNVFKQNNE